MRHCDLIVAGAGTRLEGLTARSGGTRAGALAARALALSPAVAATAVCCLGLIVVARGLGRV